MRKTSGNLVPQRIVYAIFLTTLAAALLVGPQASRKPCYVPAWDTPDSVKPALRSTAEAALSMNKNNPTFDRIGNTFALTLSALAMLGVIFDPGGRFDPSLPSHINARRMAFALTTQAFCLAVVQVWVFSVCPSQVPLIHGAANIVGLGAYGLSQIFLGRISTLRLRIVAGPNEALRAQRLLNAFIAFGSVAIILYNVRRFGPAVLSPLTTVFGGLAMLAYLLFQAQTLIGFTQGACRAFAEAKEQGEHVKETKWVLATALAAWASAATTVMFLSSQVLLTLGISIPFLNQSFVALDISSDACLALLCSGLLGAKAFDMGSVRLVGQLAATRRQKLIQKRLASVAAAVTGPAVTLAAIFEGKPAEELMETAMKRFRAIRWGVLKARPEIIRKGGALDVIGAGAADLYNLSCSCAIGACDAFWSHSWHDNGDQKWTGISNWCSEFEIVNGREAQLWLDKVCIEQTAIGDDLQCLPIFLAGCQRMVITAGSTYTDRLWCCMELFVFMTMAIDHTEVSSKNSRGSMRFSMASASSTASITRTRSSSTKGSRRSRLSSTPEIVILGTDAEERAFATDAWFHFDVRKCQCFDPRDKERMMDIVEGGVGGAESFNGFIRDLAKQLFPKHVASLACDKKGDDLGTSAGAEVEDVYVLSV